MLFSAQNFLQSAWEIVVSNLTMIPSTFYGIIIGSFFSILGIHLSNRLRLKSERDLRLFDEKRKSYAECLEGAQSAIALIADSAKVQNSEDDFINAATEIRIKFSKQSLLGNVEVFEKANQFNTLFGSEYLKYSLLRIKCRIYIQKATVSRGIAAEASSRQEKLLDLQREMNLGGTPDASKWDMCQRMFEDETKSVDDWTKDAEENDRNNLKQQINIMHDMLDTLPKFTSPYVELLECIRKDIGVEFDRNEFERATIKSMADARGYIIKFIQELNEILDAELRSAE